MMGIQRFTIGQEVGISHNKTLLVQKHPLGDSESCDSCALVTNTHIPNSIHSS